MKAILGWLNSVSAKIAAHWEKLKGLGIIVVGWTGNKAIESLFNYLIYPFIILKYGVLVGVPICIVSSFFFCCLTFCFYDWSQQDWLGLEKLKQIREGKVDTKIGWFASRFLRGSKWLAFFYITFQYDAFMATIFMRGGAYQYNGLSWKDKKIFLLSFIIGAIMWWPLVCGVLYGGEWAWETWLKSFVNL